MTTALSINTSSLPNISNASLPKVYEAAREALATCQRIDECAEWANKSEAIASYARQSEDETLLKAAMRIKDRAIRRCGELLRELPTEQGKRTDQLRGDAPPKLEPVRHGGGAPHRRFQAAKDAGLSREQAKQALRVANVPREDFERQVESDDPPTVTKLAEQGKKPSTAHLKGRDPKDFATATKGQGALNAFVRETSSLDATTVVRGLLNHEREKLKANVKLAARWLGKLQTALKRKG